MGDEDYGIDPKVIGRLAREIIEAQQAGAEIGVVIGGGNIFRGAGLAAGGMDRVTGDQMGMLATVINALAMQDALEKLGARVRVMSAIKINDVRSEEHTSELQSLMRISYAVFCLKKKNKKTKDTNKTYIYINNQITIPQDIQIH